MTRAPTRAERSAANREAWAKHNRPPQRLAPPSSEPPADNADLPAWSLRQLARLAADENVDVADRIRAHAVIQSVAKKDKPDEGKGIDADELRRLLNASPAVRKAIADEVEIAETATKQ